MFEEIAGFSEPALIDHDLGASSDTVSQFGSIRVEPGSEAGSEVRFADGVGLISGDGAAGEFVDFESADDASEVLWMESPGGHGVNLLQLVVDPMRAMLPGEFIPAAADFPVGWRALSESAEECFEVESGAADEEWSVSALQDGCSRDGGVFEVFGDAEFLIRIDEIEQVMGDLELFGEAGFCGADIHVAVDGHGIEGEDFGVELLSEEQRNGGLAGGGGAGEEAAVGKQVFREGHMRSVRGGVEFFTQPGLCFCSSLRPCHLRECSV